MFFRGWVYTRTRARNHTLWDTKMVAHTDGSRPFRFISYCISPGMYLLYRTSSLAAPALGLTQNGAKASTTVKSIIDAIQDVVDKERGRRMGSTITEEQTRDLVMRALLHHKAFRPYRAEGLIPDDGGIARIIIGALKEMNTMLAALSGSTDGWRAR